MSKFGLQPFILLFQHTFVKVVSDVISPKFTTLDLTALSGFLPKLDTFLFIFFGMLKLRM